MTRPTLGEQIRDPASPLVRDALTRKCGVCQAEPGHYCANTMPPGGLLAERFGRVVHFIRTEILG